MIELLNRCELCNKDKHSCEKQPAGYFLCPDCKAKVESRKKQTVATSTETKSTEVSTQGQYIIDRNELRALRMDGLLPIKTYIYFALSLDYPKDSDADIDAEEFCDRWKVSIQEFLVATAALTRKGIIHLKTKRLTIQTSSRQSRIAALEKAVSQ